MKRECNYCMNCITCGEGDAICLEAEEPILVIDNYTSTKNYTWCKGEKFENAG